MTYKFTIPTKAKKTPSLNDYIKSERVRIRTRGGKFLTKGAVMKSEWQQAIAVYILNELRGKKVEKPVVIHYQYYEENARRDIGNIHAPVQKFVEDALQDCGVIPNDNQKWVVGFTARFAIDKENPRIEVTLEETD